MMRGRCLCGAVSFEAEPEAMHTHACHCDMCRRWTGSALMAVPVGAGGLNLSGAEHVRTIASSDWAERAWCDRCGTGLYYRVTADGPHGGRHFVALGTFDEPEAFAFEMELYIDRKPGSYAFAGERKALTGAQVEAMFSGDGE